MTLLRNCFIGEGFAGLGRTLESWSCWCPVTNADLRYRLALPFPVISGLTAPQGFVFSLFPVLPVGSPWASFSPISGVLRTGKTARDHSVASAPVYEVVVGDVFAENFGKWALRLRGTSNGRTFQVEQQMVAGPHSAGYPLGYRGMDEHRPAGIRPHRPFRRLP